MSKGGLPLVILYWGPHQPYPLPACGWLWDFLFAILHLASGFQTANKKSHLRFAQGG